MSKAEARRRPVALGHVYLCVLTHITFVTEKRRKVQVWNRDAQKKKYCSSRFVLLCSLHAFQSKKKKENVCCCCVLFKDGCETHLTLSLAEAKKIHTHTYIYIYMCIYRLIQK